MPIEQNLIQIRSFGIQPQKTWLSINTDNYRDLNRQVSAQVVSKGTQIASGRWLEKVTLLPKAWQPKFTRSGNSHKYHEIMRTTRAS